MKKKKRTPLWQVQKVERSRDRWRAKAKRLEAKAEELESLLRETETFLEVCRDQLTKARRAEGKLKVARDSFECLTKVLGRPDDGEDNQS
jgi:hypothetical protein